MKQVSMKKMLMVASVPSMIGLFNIEICQDFKANDISLSVLVMRSTR